MMSNTTKEQQRAELHRVIWKIANDLRGNVDGWDFKQYVLVMLFYRFISENLSTYIDKLQKDAGVDNFIYAEIKDDAAKRERTSIVLEKGFFIYPSQLFENIRKGAASDDNLNQTLERIFKDIEASAQGTPSERNMEGLFDDIDVNSNRLGGTAVERNEKLVKLLNAIGGLNLGNFSDNTIDLFGDAYEYLMTMYAANAGKSGGEFFTPQEVSKLLAQIAVVGRKEVNKVYDPACGSGSLLLKFAEVLGKENVRNGFFGQEINITTYNLCRINMFLHNINYGDFYMAHGDTLTNPLHWDDEPFEAIVSNPPYSTSWDGDSDATLINDERFTPAGVLAPKGAADLAFVMHALSWLATNGTAAIVSFPGVMYRPHAEQKIRKYLVDNNFVDAVIQLPPDLFFGTQIATCILVMKRNKSDSKVLFIDATNEFTRAEAKNKLREANMDKILECYTSRKSRDYFSCLVDKEEIARKNYNLSVGTYVASEDKREVIDITELNTRIEKIVARQNELRTQIDAIVMDDLIAQYCPDGVEFRELGTIAKRNKGTPITASKMKDLHSENAPIRIFAGGKTIADVNEGDIPSKDVTHVPSIIVKSRGNIGFEYYDKPFSHKNELWSYSVLDTEINQKFIYYYLLTQTDKLQRLARSKSVKLPQLSTPDTDFLKVPIPPLEVQEEIVAILDKFDALVNDILNGLPAEINARRQQYEHYRNKLLTFKET